ncbi:hypothetical protein [Caldinitratiruptor microaerophilus]|uniref:DNA helicase n=1 Tax=Caldinitratiruptor microaerophilus TaxID=671077 RepID=A0AA35CHS0_9FIRM|nr:hypothetical protein [Caldinitratiruptor microaerophilus]BDG59117.1 hypothetical protein caldi_02070 [Caldinitratiruptor microaerophilus]
MATVELLVGPTGSGKTTRLARHCRALRDAGERPDGILVLVPDGRRQAAWREHLGTPVPAVQSLYGFMAAEVRLFWPLLAPEPEHAGALEPLVVDGDVTAHLLRTLLVHRRATGPLAYARASDRRLAFQLEALLWAATSAGMDLPAAAERLASAGTADPQVLTQARDILDAYRQCLQAAGAADFPLVTELYVRRLFPLPAYRAHLRERARHVVVDDLHEAPPVLHDVIAALAGEARSAVLAAGADGGRPGRTWDAVTALQARLGGDVRVTLLTGCYTGSPAAARTAAALAARLRPGDPATAAAETPPGPLLPIRRLHAEFRPEMLRLLGQAVREHMDAGVSPGDIAVLSPWPDAALREAIREAGAPVLDLSPSPLAAQPCVRALLALVALARPGALPGAGHDLLRDGLGWLLGLDPVRSSALAAAVGGGASSAPDPALLHRVGFLAGERWERVRGWLQSVGEGSQPGPADLLARAVAEAIAPLTRQAAALEPCARAVEIARQVERITTSPAYPEPGRDPLSAALEAVLHGRWDPGAAPRRASRAAGRRDAVVLTTPWRFLAQGLAARVQVWADVTAPGWLPSGAGPLANPHVLAPGWPEGAVWTDAHGAAARRDAAAGTVSALLRRCREALVVGSSAVDAAGHDSPGGLLPLLDEAMAGAAAGGAAP